MNKKIVICGSRDYRNYEEAKLYIEECLKKHKMDKDIIILSGGAKGADSLGERYAEEKGYPMQQFPAEWNRYGKAAGPKRNQTMAENCDLLICFWDGESRGTASMIRFAEKYSKPMEIKLI